MLFGLSVFPTFSFLQLIFCVHIHFTMIINLHICVCVCTCVCVCMGGCMHREAVEHFLTALNMQQRSRGPSGQQTQMSKNIWSTMRMTLSLMGRSDLYSACESMDVGALNEEFGMNQ